MIGPKPVVVVLGGYGVFGGRLARRLAGEGAFDVVVAGRSETKAAAFCARHGGRPAAIDSTTDGFARDLADLVPFAVVDAAGPFHGGRPYDVARAAMACGAHALDLSDDAAFTAGIAALDDAAKAAGVVVLSGVSSVPALSSAAADALTEGMDEVRVIESAILPGNRAPRGLAVMRSILAQAGRPVGLWRDGRRRDVPGWSGLRRMRLAAGERRVPGTRLASFIGAPDLALFPARYGARSVLFRAGLDLGIMHRGLAALALPVRWGIVRSIEPLAKPLRRAAQALQPFGSGEGGMITEVTGMVGERLVRRRWTLIVGSEDGPAVPAIPAYVMLHKLVGETVPPGARPCLGEMTLADVEIALSPFDHAMDRIEELAPRVFERVLSDAWPALPPTIRDLHDVSDLRRWTGTATITRGRGLRSRLAGRVAGFPPAGEGVPVTVEMERCGEAEVWRRRFGDDRFSSVLSPGPDVTAGHRVVRERFGLLVFDIALRIDDGQLRYPVTGGRLLGVPLPRFLLPVSDTAETDIGGGRVRFDVRIALPAAGHVVTYRGEIAPDLPITGNVTCPQPPASVTRPLTTGR